MSLALYGAYRFGPVRCLHACTCSRNDDGTCTGKLNCLNIFFIDPLQQHYVTGPEAASYFFLFRGDEWRCLWFTWFSFSGVSSLFSNAFTAVLSAIECLLFLRKVSTGNLPSFHASSKYTCLVSDRPLAMRHLQENSIFRRTMRMLLTFVIRAIVSSPGSLPIEDEGPVIDEAAAITERGL